ncbi:hypothetical protein [Streptomyces canus]|nr:hypothetical protein [Streptomyces canus]
MGAGRGRRARAADEWSVEHAEQGTLLKAMGPERASVLRAYPQP